MLTMNFLSSRAYRIFGLVWLLSGMGFVGPATADVTGDWQLAGKLQVTATVKGKSQSFKQTGLAGITAVFGDDAQCAINAGTLAIEGSWSAVKRNFKTQLSLSSADALLRVIEKDLTAKSGLSVLLGADQLTLSGTELKNGKIKGRLKIKAHGLFLDYANKKGGLTMTYDFTGTRVVPNQAMQAAEVE